MNDDATGKPCPGCGAPMVSLSSLKRRQCIDCGKAWPWELNPGQLPLVSSNRATRKTG